MAGARVVVEHVSRRYRDTLVLSGVNLELEPGELVSLTGPSGSGKTTLLQLIGSLDRPSEGRITVDGVSVGELKAPAEYRRSTVGFVFQLHYLLPGLTARQNVELPMAATRARRQERSRRALELLAEVGLSGRADDLPAELSGGERQRVAIARALANRPRLLLADEPTGALDSGASIRIWDLLDASRKRHGTTVLIASHDPTLAEHADWTIHLEDGRIRAPAELVEDAGRPTAAEDPR